MKVAEEAPAEVAYRAADARLRGSGMPGMEEGLRPPQTGTDHPDRGAEWARADWAPDEPWVRTLILLSDGRREDAATALRAPAP
jgi:hypothetical protein